ncbi:hypothetical protein ACNKHR_04235 [Shigella flexneri]
MACDRAFRRLIQAARRRLVASALVSLWGLAPAGAIAALRRPSPRCSAMRRATSPWRRPSCACPAC